MSAENSDYDYKYKTEFQIWRENQEFERQNISMSQPPLESIPIDMNMTNTEMSHLDSTPVGTKTPDPKPLTRLPELLKQNGKAHLLEDPESDLSSLDSSLIKSDSSDDIKYRKSKIKRRNKKKIVGNIQNRTCQTHR